MRSSHSTSISINRMISIENLSWRQALVLISNKWSTACCRHYIFFLVDGLICSFWGNILSNSASCMLYLWLYLTHNVWTQQHLLHGELFNYYMEQVLSQVWVEEYCKLFNSSNIAQWFLSFCTILWYKLKNALVNIKCHLYHSFRLLGFHPV